MVLARPATRAAILTPQVPPNLILKSEALDNAAWTKFRASASANAAAGPLGATVADKLVEDSTATQTHLARQVIAGLGGVYNLSVYLKAAGRTFAWVRTTSPVVAVEAYVNLTTGALGATVGTWTVVDAGNGWWRFAVPLTMATASLTVDLYLASNITTVTYNGDGTSGMYLGGMQLTKGPGLLPYWATP
jgi:hypothetical protein